MLKVYSNFTDPKLFEDALEDFKDKSITIFYDYPTFDRIQNLEMFQSYKNKFLENDYNFLFLQEPNEYFGIHKLVEDHISPMFTAILTWNLNTVENIEHAMYFPCAMTWLDKPYIENVDSLEKKFEVSFLCGAKKKLAGHNVRHELWDKREQIKVPKKFFYTLDDYDNEKDLVMDMSGKKILWNSMFNVSIENSYHRGYYTEKTVDAFLTKTVPILCGCPNIGEYYDERGVILFEDASESIEKINKLTEQDYHDRKEYIDKNYKLALWNGDYFKRVKSFIKDFVDGGERI